MAEVQHAIRLPGILTLRELGGDVLDAIVLDVLEEQTVTHDDAINVDEK
jgi:hypothetical protein